MTGENSFKSLESLSHTSNFGQRSRGVGRSAHHRPIEKPQGVFVYPKFSSSRFVDKLSKKKRDRFKSGPFEEC